MKAVFLDRDNTLILNEGDLGDPEKVVLCKHVGKALSKLHDMGYCLIVVTNQGGVARGKYTEQDVDAVHQKIAELVDDEAGKSGIIDRFYYCPYHPEGTIPQYRRDHPWRKPQPGMLVQAARDLNLKLGECWMVGDQVRDIQAGIAAGCNTVMVTNGNKVRNNSGASYTVETMLDAAASIELGPPKIETTPVRKKAKKKRVAASTDSREHPIIRKAVQGQSATAEQGIKAEETVIKPTATKTVGKHPKKKTTSTVEPKPIPKEDRKLIEKEAVEPATHKTEPVPAPAKAKSVAVRKIKVETAKREPLTVPVEIKVEAPQPVAKVKEQPPKPPKPPEPPEPPEPQAKPQSEPETETDFKAENKQTFEAKQTPYNDIGKISGPMSATPPPANMEPLRRAVHDLAEEIRTERLRKSEFTLLRLGAGLAQLTVVLLGLLALNNMNDFEMFAKWMLGAVLVQLLTATLLLMDSKS